MGKTKQAEYISRMNELLVEVFDVTAQRDRMERKRLELNSRIQALHTWYTDAMKRK